MRKFSKINENKEKILDVMGIDENSIKDICQELIDEFGFEMTITTRWISKSGKIFYKSNQSSESYPSLNISLTREIDLSLSEDPRNWDSSIYYENDFNLLKILYETILHLESMLEKGEIKVFYTIRSMGDIQLRITTPIEESELPIDVENVINFIENEIEDLNDLPYQEYKVESSWSHGSRRGIEILPKETSFRTDLTRIGDNAGDIILSRIIKMGDNNNKNELINIANHIIKRLLDSCNKKGKKVNGLVAQYYDEDLGIVFITHNGQNIIKFIPDVQIITKGNVITRKGIFKDESTHIIIYKLELEIEILVE